MFKQVALCKNMPDTRQGPFVFHHSEWGVTISSQTPTLLNSIQPLGKIHLFSNIGVTLEPMQ